MEGWMRYIKGFHYAHYIKNEKAICGTEIQPILKVTGNSFWVRIDLNKFPIKKICRSCILVRYHMCHVMHS